MPGRRLASCVQSPSGSSRGGQWERAVLPILVLVVALGAGARFYGLRWGLPYHFHNDEYVLAQSTESLRTGPSLTQVARDARFHLYPPLLMYLLIGSVRAAAFLHHPVTPEDPSRVTAYFLLGRLIVAAFGSATLGLVYLLGRRLYCRATGLLAAAFLAFSVLHVRDSHFYFPDVPFTFFAVLTVIFAADLARDGRIRSYVVAGLAAGIGLATKQTGLLVLPVILAAHVAYALRGKPFSLAAVAGLLRSARLWGCLVLPFGVAAVTFLLLDPFVLVAPDRFLAMSQRTEQFVRGIEQPTYTFQFTDTTILYWVTNLLYFALGPPLEVVSLLGLGWAVARRRLGDVLLLAFLVPYVWFVCAGYMKFIRYAVPLLPFLCLFAARFLVELSEVATTRVGRLAAAALPAAVLVASVLYTLAYLNVYRERDARIQASEWIHRNIPRRATVLIDSSSATPLLGSLFFEPRFEASYRRRYAVRSDYFTIKAMNLIVEPGERAHPDTSAWWAGYLADRLENAQYIVMSDEYSEQYSHRPDAYPTLNAFYRDLSAGTAGYRLVQTFKVYPALFGYQLDDDRAELTFRLFDHPRIMIFERRPDGPPPGQPVQLGRVGLERSVHL
jgi:4-amino-4-deoxy-L-arabinose transferase-like glycosyltransferase